MNLLKAIYLRLRKVVAGKVLKFGVDNRGSDGTGSFSIKVRTELTDTRIARLIK